MFGIRKRKKQSLETNQGIADLQTRTRDKERDIYIREVLQDKKLPIVVIDPMWYSIKEQISSPIIKKNEEKLGELLKEQGKINNDIKEYSMVKQNLLKEILVVSEQVNEKGETHKDNLLQKLHDTILKTNEKIQELEAGVDTIKQEIKETNFLIIEETIGIGYEYMEVYKEEKIRLEKEIDALREQVVLKTKEKKQYDDKFSKIYNYMHEIIGYKFIDKVDKKLWGKEK